MANYKETDITGSSYTRCNQVLINNALDVTPTVHFDEQMVVLLETGGSIVRGAGGIDVVFDPAKSIALINPATGEPTGSSISYGELYAMLYSAYIDAALARDAEQPLETIGA